MQALSSLIILEALYQYILWDCSVLDGCSKDELEQDCLGNQFVFILVLKRVLIRATLPSLLSYFLSLFL